MSETLSNNMLENSVKPVVMQPANAELVNKDLKDDIAMQVDLLRKTIQQSPTPDGFIVDTNTPSPAGGIIDAQSEIIFKLAEIVEARSQETGSHVMRVAELSYLLATKAGLSEAQTDMIHLAAPMHDVGKVSIPDAILHNRGQLTEEELEIMKTHTRAGYHMLRGSRKSILKAAAIIALQHHERFDGKGYPLGLVGKDTNIMGRIVCLADVFDTLSNDRVYRPAWKMQQIIEHIKSERGQKFDPDLVDVFMENITEFKKVLENHPSEQLACRSEIVRCYERARAGKAKRTTAMAPTSAPAPIASSQTVLLAGFDGSINDMLTRKSGECGYQAMCADDAGQAWRILKKDNAPHMAIINFALGSNDISDLCRKVRKLRGQDYTYIILVADKANDVQTQEAIHAGADHCIHLPIDERELEVRLHAAQRILDLQTELIEARESLREQATKDALTNLWNRGAILEILNMELSRAERNGTSVAVIMADLDYFKKINDTYGHQAGDAVLRETANRMRQSVRPYDGFARYGGEEFLIVLPRCDETFGADIAERLRNSLAGKPIQIEDGELEVTISVGVVARQGTACVDADTLIQKADEALYLAKAAGRNCVMIAPPEKPES